MATFQYKAHREDETAVEGQIEADDLESALRALKKQGLIVASIHQLEIGQAETGAPPAAPSPAHPAEAEQLALKRQLSRVLATGQFLVPALLAYAQDVSPGKLRRRLERLAKQLKQARDPSQELVAGQIDEQWISLLSASASSGDAGQILSGIIDESQRAGDIRRHFVQVLAYPLLLLAVSLAILSFLAWWITPIFGEIFADFGAEVPHLTDWVLSISTAIRELWWVALILGLLLAAFLSYFKGFRDWIIRRMPLIGFAVRLSDRARFTRCLADLIQAEVCLSDALRISGRHTRQAALRREANRLAAEMETGSREFACSPSLSPILPHTAVHVLQAKADPRAAAQILRELSWMYEQQTRNRFAWIASVTSPIFIIVLAAAVGFYVVALFLPLVKLIQNLT